MLCTINQHPSIYITMNWLHILLLLYQVLKHLQKIFRRPSCCKYCIILPSTSKHLLEKVFGLLWTPKNIPETPSQEVFAWMSTATISDPWFCPQTSTTHAPFWQLEDQDSEFAVIVTSNGLGKRIPLSGFRNLRWMSGDDRGGWVFGGLKKVRGETGNISTWFFVRKNMCVFGEF